MILCLGCKKLWPRGSNWCGTCRCTLGKRVCSEGHENMLTSECCTTCGTRILSTGVRCINLRPITLLSGIAVMCVVCSGVLTALPNLVASLEHYFFSFFERALMFVLTTFFMIAIFGGILSMVFGEKASKLFTDLLSMTFKFLLSALRIPLKLATKKGKKKD